MALKKTVNHHKKKHGGKHHRRSSSSGGYRSSDGGGAPPTSVECLSHCIAADFDTSAATAGYIATMTAEPDAEQQSAQESGFAPPGLTELVITQAKKAFADGTAWFTAGYAGGFELYNFAH
ncbi:hypothetical protein PLESTB_001814900 [Pleodorina starrii]|uniref:Uncharacterized protein n=1 Tax=Pleodorina starrii TaxID=330485 RepID=A0A9W6FA09_9CHLO|nr:hypothetical protein PLESTM_001400900 [Pleodorina starrii]GLC61889.1 hypothetical protein PLESTB_001814900 [Pleodorina starrii]GLC75911.1 hypothetical protein PLESTF_001705200 [Pleodorina starrii]